jgi:hypothetical protein
MLKYIIAILFTGTLSTAQEVGDLIPKESATLKYGFSHEEYRKGDQVMVEEWVQMRSSDLAVSMDIKDRSKMRAQLNTTFGKLLGQPKLKGLQIEGRLDTHRTDYLLLGSELKVAPQFNMFLAGVVNDSDKARVIYGPYLYLAPKSYIAILFYPGEDQSAFQVRTHWEFKNCFMDINGTVKKKDGEGARDGGMVRVGYGPVSAKYEFAPYYDGSNYDRKMYGVDVSWVF